MLYELGQIACQALRSIVSQGGPNNGRSEKGGPNKGSQHMEARTSPGQSPRSLQHLPAEPNAAGMATLPPPINACLGPHISRENQMLTEILDRWETMIELQQQRATWQLRWDQAQAAFEQSLRSIDARDAERLKRVLAESLPRLANSLPSAATTMTNLPEASPPCASTASDTPTGPPAENDSPAACNSPAACTSPAESALNPDPTPATSDVDTTASEIAEPAPLSPAAATELEEQVNEEATLDELLTWATEVVGDGVTENVLFQELRKSKHARQARQLFDALKELDAFYETEDDVIRIHSLKSMGL
jgi:hypothetical protein